MYLDMLHWSIFEIDNLFNELPFTKNGFQLP